jgi:hypothetical protein
MLSPHLALILAALAHTLTIHCKNDARVVFHADDSRTYPRDFKRIIGRPDSGDGKLAGGVKHNENEQVFDLTPAFGVDLDAKPLYFTVQANAGYADEKKHTVCVVMPRAGILGSKGVSLLCRRCNVKVNAADGCSARLSANRQEATNSGSPGQTTTWAIAGHGRE